MGDTAFFEALQELGPRRTLLLGTLAPPLAALLALVTLGETLPPGSWAGIGVTVAGVAWVVTERLPGARGTRGRTLRGLGFGLLATLAQASGSVLSHAALTQTTVSPLWGAFLRLSAGVVVLVVWMALARQPAGRWLRAGQTGRLWRRLLFAVFAGTYLGVWLQQVALKLTAAGIAQTLLATSPLFVLPLAAWTGERVSARAVAGAVVALVGIGMLFGLGLYAIWQEEGEAFLPKYDDLLSSTGEGTSAELAARFGIDIRDRGFWENSMRIIEARIDRYLAL